MEITQENIKHIIEAFKNLKTKQDLLEIINYAKFLIYPDVKNLKPFELKTLTYYANDKVRKNAYKKFSIPKKNGGERIILAPVKSLKVIQKCLNFIFNIIFQPSRFAHGFVLEKSVVTNARLHIGKRYVYNLDLKDFFPSVQKNRVKAVLMIKPFNLQYDLAYTIASLCCENGVLPQGAPTSPTITNIICQRMDKKLNTLAISVGAKYSRYADDITFSSEINTFKPNGKFNKELKKIIKEENFTINASKTRLQNNAFRQEVTGIIVNEKINVTRRYLMQIRAMLHNWEKLGLKKTSQIFLINYFKDKGHVKKGNPDFVNVLSGKLEYFKMVRGFDDKLYQKYFQKFNSLYDKDRLNLSDNIDIDIILHIWETEGIEKAMEYLKI